MPLSTPIIETPAGAISVTLDGDASRAEALLVCAHGAGGSMNDRGMLAASAALVDAGLAVLRFNFPYRERASGRPDPMPVLTACVAGVSAWARDILSPRRLLIGGRSMGGRAASMLAADGFACHGLLLLAYPLHPPGQLTRLRDAHLPAIRVPVLCFSGTRDPFCDPALMRQALGAVRSPWTMHWLDGADHSFHVLKRSGRTNADVMAEVSTVTRAWLSGIAAPGAP